MVSCKPLGPSSTFFGSAGWAGPGTDGVDGVDGADGVAGVAGVPGSESESLFCTGATNFRKSPRMMPPCASRVYVTTGVKLLKLLSANVTPDLLEDLEPLNK
ncbi:hypothetical protein D3C76_962900 [compost metagenome]